jgi:hypothetical protein
VIEFYLPELVQGEEVLDEEIMQETDEELYYLDDEITIEKKGFDEESLALLQELGFDSRARGLKNSGS